MKIEDVTKAVDLKRRIKEYQDDIDQIKDSSEFWIYGKNEHGGTVLQSTPLSSQQTQIIIAMIIVEREEQIKAAMAELEKL